MSRYPLIFFIHICFFTCAQQLQDTIRFIALGDSYTIGQSVSDSDRWPNQFVDSLSELGFTIEENNILATTGWTTRDLLGALDNSSLGQGYNLVSILIGVNNFYQNQSVNIYRLELSQIIDHALTLTNQDTNGLFLITIPDYGYTPFGENQKDIISYNTNLYNQIMDSTATEYGIPLVNITSISRNGLIDNDLVAIDGLHPSKKQYRMWVNMILHELINNSTKSTEQIENNIDYVLNQSGNEFQFYSESNIFLEIYDLRGRRIKRLHSNIEFNLPSGIFLIRVISKGKVFTHKIVI